MKNYSKVFSFVITFVFCCLFSTRVSLAAEYYVSPSGQDSNPGTLAQPFKTIKGNIWRMFPGDTMYLRGGSYEGDQLNPIRSGTADHPMIFKAYNQEKPVLANIPGPTQAMYFYNLSYITVDGVGVDNVDGHWASVWVSSYLTFKNCNFKNVSRNIIGFYIIHSNHITVQNCVMDRVSDPTITQDKDLMYVEDTHYSLFENLVLTRGPHSLIGMQNSTYNIVRNNVLKNDWQKDLGLAAPSRTDLGHNVIENNLIYGSRPAIAAGYEGKGAMGIYLNQKGNIIRRNQIYDNDNFGILADGNNALGNSNVSDNRVYNNVIFGNGKAKKYDNGGGVTITDFFSNLFMGNNSFKNNIIANNIGFNLYVNSRLKQFEGNQFAGNCFAGAVNPLTEIKVEGIGTNSLAWFQSNYSSNVYSNTEANPSFVNPTLPNPDFHLNSQSPCIDKGVPLTLTDNQGTGSTISLGDASYFSDGFGIAGGDTITIGSDTGLKVIAVDYANNNITIDKNITWQVGEPVSQTFNGQAPDPGVFEASNPPPVSPTPPAPSPVPSPLPVVNKVQGDANGDQKVDGIDYVTLVNNLDQKMSKGAQAGDFNNDGVVDINDYRIWRKALQL